MKIYSAVKYLQAIIMLLGSLLVDPGKEGAKAGEKDRVIYACVINNKSYTVGADNPRTGLFYTNSGGGGWHHMGWTNGRAFGIAVDTSTNPNSIYIAEGNGVHKSTDAGKTWAIKTGWEITEVQKIIIDPKNRNVLYIATPYGVWKSSDGGEKWEKKNKGLKEVNETFVTSVLVDRQNTSRILISTENGILESTDAGDSWHPLALQGKAVRRLIDSPNKPGLFLAGTEEDGIFFSRNAGKTWKKGNRGLKHKTFYALAADLHNSENFYAGGFKTGIYKSIDGGRSWKNFSQGLTNLDIHSIATSPLDSRIVYAGTIGDGVFQSLDGGETWKFIGLEGCQVWELKIY